MASQQWKAPGILDAAVANARLSRGDLAQRLEAIRTRRPSRGGPQLDVYNQCIEHAAILQVFNDQVRDRLFELIRSEGPDTFLVRHAMARIRDIHNIYTDILDTILEAVPDPEPAIQPAPEAMQPGQPAEGAGRVLILCRSWQSV